MNGKPVRMSTGTTDLQAARDVLKRREGQVAEGIALPVSMDKITYTEIAEDLRVYYQTTQARDLVEAAYRLAHLDHFFTGKRAVQITKAAMTRYIQSRQASLPTPANGTINRELATLSKMLRLAYEHDKLHRLPRVPRLKEAPPRAGFFEDDRYQAVCRYLPEDLQAATLIAFTFGWRMQSEIFSLERRHVDIERGIFRLDPGQDKNEAGRAVYMTPAVKAAVQGQLGRLEALQKDLGQIVPWLFPHLEGRHAGKRRKEFRKVWASACRQAGVPGMLVHDFRRTAVRNLEREGVPRSVAMKLTGHKTESVYMRYAIVNDADLQEATLRLGQAEARRGTLSGYTVLESVESGKSRSASS